MPPLEPPMLPCLVCNRAGKKQQLRAPGNVVVQVTICADCAKDEFRIKECLRRVGVSGGGE